MDKTNTAGMPDWPGHAHAAAGHTHSDADSDTKGLHMRITHAERSEEATCGTPGWTR